jgi:hypothetical protein
MKSTVLALILFLSFPAGVYAQLVTITPEGVVESKVLAETDSVELEIPQSEIDIKKVADVRFAKDASVQITRTEGKISLTIESEKGKQEMALEDWKDNLVEVEERPQTQRVFIGVYDDRFGLEHRGVVALTDYTLKVDAKTARITASTGSGERYIAVMPYSAVQTLIRSGVINNLSADNKIDLVEVDNNLVYSVQGERGINFFNIYYHTVSVEGLVSALNGQVIEVKQPKWLRILGFLFE